MSLAIRRKLTTLSYNNVIKANYSTSASSYAEQHYTRITQGRAVKVTTVAENKGRGVIATKEFKKGDKIFSEIPIALARSMKSHFPIVADAHQMHHSSFCAHCLKSLVTPDKALPDIFPKKYSLPLTDKFWPPIEVHTCETCKIEKYCSEKCKTAAKMAYHNHLCAGVSPHSHPIVQLQLECMKYDTNYPMQVARMLAMSSTLFSRLKLTDEDVMWEMTPFSKFATSTSPLPVFDSNPDAKEFVYERAYELLHEAMYKGKFPKLFSKERYIELFNAVHLNCSQIFPQSPFKSYISKIVLVRPQETLDTLVKYIQNMNRVAADMMDLPSESTSEIIFNKLSKTAGCGMFSLHSQMNHSCDPNVKCVTENSPSAQLDVVAVKDIKEGDEICIDYLGLAHTPVAERKQAIFNQFNFDCKCPKCISQSYLCFFFLYYFILFYFYFILFLLDERTPVFVIVTVY